MVYKWYILPIGGLYATCHLLGEPETTIEYCLMLPKLVLQYLVVAKKFKDPLIGRRIAILQIHFLKLTVRL